MRTTVDLPDDLVPAVKNRAAEENRTFKEMVAVLLRLGLAHSASETPPIRNRVNFPIFTGGHPAKPGEGMTPERISELLLQQEADWALGRE
jgi:hypothetical protein